VTEHYTEGQPPIAPRRRSAPEAPPPAAAPAGDLTAAQRRAAEIRQGRKPFGSMDQKLKYEQRAGFHRHWFNDEPGRINQAKEAGYEIVKDRETDVPVSRPVGTAKGGGVLMAFLMEIPEELWREDMALIQERADLVDSSIRRGKVAGDGLTAADQGKFYEPRDRPITMRQGHSR